MLRRIIALATTTFVAIAGFVMSAEAAPFNIAAGASAKDGTELVQVRGGRGGGGGGFRGGSFGGGRGFGGGHKFGGGYKFAARHFGHRPHRPGCRASWCGPHHGHGRRHWKKGFVVIGGYDAGPGCGYFYNRWQATGSYHWKAKYYACIGE